MQFHDYLWRSVRITSYMSKKVSYNTFFSYIYSLMIPLDDKFLKSLNPSIPDLYPSLKWISIKFSHSRCLLFVWKRFRTPLEPNTNHRTTRTRIGTYTASIYPRLRAIYDLGLIAIAKKVARSRPWYTCPPSFCVQTTGDCFPHRS